jgi:uncharacterized protein YegJ (DUF2314 family)
MSRGAKIALVVGCVAIGVIQALAVDEWSARAVWIAAGTWAVLATVLAAFVFELTLARIALAALVAFGCSWYLYDALAERLPAEGARGSQSSILAAVACFLIFGLPAYRYLYKVVNLFARRAFRLPLPAEALPPMVIDADDPLMIEAVRRARASLERFRSLQRDEANACYVKIPLEAEHDLTEHVWGRVMDMDELRVRVSPANEPVAARAPADDDLDVPLEAISDWTVEMSDGSVQGGFSTIAMFRRAKERGDQVPAEIEESIPRFVDAASELDGPAPVGVACRSDARSASCPPDAHDRQE